MYKLCFFEFAFSKIINSYLRMFDTFDTVFCILGVMSISEVCVYFDSPLKLVYCMVEALCKKGKITCRMCSRILGENFASKFI